MDYSKFACLTILTLSILFNFSASGRTQTANGLRAAALMDGNEIAVDVHNTGMFSGYVGGADFQWARLGYGRAFCFFAGAEVPVPRGSHPDAFPVVENGDTTWMAHVVSDGFLTGGEYSPDGSNRWGWQPVVRHSSGTPVYLQGRDVRSMPLYPAYDLNMDGIPLN